MKDVDILLQLLEYMEYPNDTSNLLNYICFPNLVPASILNEMFDPWETFTFSTEQ